jgi:hypothetical protein
VADRLAPLDTSALKARRATCTNAEPRDLRGILLSAALALFLLDAIIVAILGGGIAALLRDARRPPRSPSPLHSPRSAVFLRRLMRKHRNPGRKLRLRHLPRPAVRQMTTSPSRLSRRHDWLTSLRATPMSIPS